MQQKEKKVFPKLPFDSRVLFLIGIVISLFGFTFATSYPGITVRDEWVRGEDGKAVSIRAFIPPQYANNSPGVLLIHGFSGTKKDAELKAYQLALRGIVAVTMDMRGHGLSEGPFLFGMMEASDGAKVIEWMVSHLNVNGSNIGIYGHSMGGLVALRIAALYYKPRAMVVLHPPWNAETLAVGQIFRRMLGDYFYSLFQEASPSNFLNSSWDIPLILLHGTADPTVPPIHSEYVYNAVNGSAKEWVKLVIMQNYGHADLEQARISHQYTVFWFEAFLLSNRSITNLETEVSQIEIVDYFHSEIFYPIVLTGAIIAFLGLLYSFPHYYIGTNPTPPRPRSAYALPICLYIGATIGKISVGIIYGAIGGFILALALPFYDLQKQLRTKPKGFQRIINLADVFLLIITFSAFMVLVGIVVFIPYLCHEAVCFNFNGFLVYSLMAYPIALFLEILRSQDSFDLKKSVVRGLEISILVVLSIMITLVVDMDIVVAGMDYTYYVIPFFFFAIFGLTILQVLLDTLNFVIKSMYARALIVAMTIGLFLATQISIFA
ncbi:MAG: alpha/beta fold hydrolase [Candidatus Korarchaeota archaeon]